MFSNQGRTPFCFMLIAVFSNLQLGSTNLVDKLPTKTVAVLGSSVSFRCSTTKVTKDIQWFHNPAGDKKLIYGWDVFRAPYLNRFEIDTSNGSRITIPKTQESDIGVYQCADDVERGDKSETQLILLDTAPICTPNGNFEVPDDCGPSNNRVTVLCSVAYKGGVPPDLTWKEDGNGDSIKDGVHCNNTSNPVTCNLTITDRNVTSYRCDTGGLSQCSVSPIFTGQYAYNNHENYEANKSDEITCQPKSNGICSFGWFHTNDSKEVLVSTSSKLIPQSLGYYRCQAECQLSTQKCTVSASSWNVVLPYVEPLTSPDNWKTVAIVIIVIVIIEHVVIGILIKVKICVVKFTSKDKKKDTIEESEKTGKEKLPLQDKSDKGKGDAV